VENTPIGIFDYIHIIHTEHLALKLVDLTSQRLKLSSLRPLLELLDGQMYRLW